MNSTSDAATTAAAEAAEIARLQEENKSLKNRIDWFEKQFFGQKSEKRLVDNQ